MRQRGGGGGCRPGWTVELAGWVVGLVVVGCYVRGGVCVSTWWDGCRPRRRVDRARGCLRQRLGGGSCRPGSRWSLVGAGGRVGHRRPATRAGACASAPGGDVAVHDQGLIERGGVVHQRGGGELAVQDGRWSLRGWMVGLVVHDDCFERGGVCVSSVGGGCRPGWTVELAGVGGCCPTDGRTRAGVGRGGRPSP